MFAAVVPGANKNWEIRDLPTPKPSATQIREEESLIFFADSETVFNQYNQIWRARCLAA